MDLKTTRAPYNFVPVPNQIIWRYEDASQVPGHNVLDPHLLSGEIRVTVTAKTPIYIAGRERTGFVKDARGRYIIPGSSLRGLLRQNMQILGMGLIRAGEDMDDSRLLYRDMASGKGTVTHSLRERYEAVLGIDSKNSTPTAVKGGYLHNDGGRYYIVPTVSDVICINRKDPVVASWANKYAFEQQVWYLLSGAKVVDIRGDAVEGYVTGVLLSPGFMPGQKRLYLFPAENPDLQLPPLTVKEVLTYQNDVKMKANGLKGTSEAHPMNPGFWNMPEPGGVKAVFYAKDSEGFTTFGVSRFLRIGYLYSLGNGLPDKHRENRDSVKLDYPRSMLGYAWEDSAYRSRVSVGNLVAVGAPKSAASFPVVLGNPKASFIAGYSKKGKDYNQEGFQLSGIKQYWMKPEYAPPLSSDSRSKDADNQMISTMHPLTSGTQFTGTIRYRNLHQDELGLLLWCLRLDENCFQTIGMGKPYGFGRVQIRIDALQEFDIENLYRDLTTGAIQRGKTAERVDKLICAYDAYACEQPGIKNKKGSTTLRSKAHIRDFLYMKSTVSLNADKTPYMSLDEHQNLYTTLPTVADIRKEATASQTQVPAIDPTDWKAMAAARNAQNAANTASGQKKKGMW